MSCVRACVRAGTTGTSAVNLRRYGDTPQTITIYDLVEILLLWLVRGARDVYIFMSLVLFTISTTWFNDIDNIIIIQFYHAIHDQISCSLNHR